MWGLHVHLCFLCCSVCSPDASVGCRSCWVKGEQRGGGKQGAFRESEVRDSMWGLCGQMLMSTSEPLFSFWARAKHIWPILGVFWIRWIAFWQCLLFSHDCVGWDWLRWRDQHNGRSWIQPRLACYLSVRVPDALTHFRTAVGCGAEGIWGSLGHPWLHSKLVGKSRVLMLSWAWLHKTTFLYKTHTRKQCYVLQSAVCGLCSQV